MNKKNSRKRIHFLCPGQRRAQALFVLLLLLPPAMIIGVVFLISRSGFYTLFPGNDLFFSCALDASSHKGIAKIINFKKNPRQISLDYQVMQSDLNQYPKVNLRLETVDRKKVDMSGFDRVKLDIKSSVSILVVRINTRVLIKEPGNLHMTEIALSLDHSIKIATPGRKTYTLDLKNFHIPAWWYGLHSINDDLQQSIDFSGFTSIELVDSRHSEIPTRTILYGVVFHKNRLIPAVISFAITALYAGLLLIIRLIRKEKNKPGIALEQDIVRQIVITNYQDEIEKKILDYISLEYKNQGLTLWQVAKQAGLSERKVSVFFKNRFGLTFKEYINRKRITKAKHLLLSSSKAITEIAYLLGFSNSSHFSLLFKKMEKITPTQFRKNAGP